MERSKDWIDEAEGDLQHAKNDLEGGFYNWACFSAQQSSEKVIKAVFYRMKAEVWGHSVSDLLIELSNHHSVPQEIIDDAIELDKSYIAARYPDAHPSGSPRKKYTQREARRLIKYAENIFQFCSGLLSEIQ